VKLFFDYETTPGMNMLVYGNVPSRLEDGSSVTMAPAAVERVLENIRKAFEWRGFCVEIARAPNVTKDH